MKRNRLTELRAVLDDATEAAKAHRKACSACSHARHAKAPWLSCVPGWALIQGRRTARAELRAYEAHLAELARAQGELW